MTSTEGSIKLEMCLYFIKWGKLSIEYNATIDKKGSKEYGFTF